MPAPIRLEVLANGSRAKRELNDVAATAERSTGRIRGSASRAGKALALGVGAGVAVAGAAVLKFGTDAVKSASNAQQSLGATRTVFGRYARDVIKDSNNAARSVGLSANEYRELANVMGASLSGAGIPLKQTAKLTADINKRAADMAATFGGPTSKAVEAIGSLMRGEADPIEAYGVSIKQADVNARLAAKGQDELTGAAAKQAEMQARLDLLMQKTSKTQGAFARESGTLANQQQILAAQFENTKAKVGTALLPVLTRAFTWMNDTGLPAAKRLGSYLADTFGPVFAAVGGFIKSELIPAIRDLAERWLAGARKAFENIRAAMDRNKGTITDLKNAFSAVWGFIKGSLLPLLGRFYETVLPAIGTAIGKVIDGIKVWMEIFRTLWNVVLQPIIKLILRSFASLMDSWGALLRALGKVPGFEWATKAGDKMIAAAGGARDLAKNIRDIPPLTKVEVNTKFTYTGLRAPGGSGPTRGRNDEFLGASPRESYRLGQTLGKASGKGLADGILSMRGKVADAGDKAGKRATDGLKKGLKIGAAPVLAAASNLGEKIIAKIEEKISSAEELRDSITSLRDSLAGALTGDLFGGTGDETGTALDKFRAALGSAKATADNVREAVRKLLSQGVSGTFLEGLLGSGNSELILQLSGASDAKTLADAYASVIATNEETGRLVAEEVIGTRLDQVTNVLADLGKQLEEERVRAREERRAPVQVRFTSEQIDQLTRGKRIAADLRAWEQAGGRRVS